MAPNSFFKPAVELLLLLAFLRVVLPRPCHSASIRCSETERNALLELKKGLYDPGHRLSTWVGDNCCGWHGVRCNNRSGHVVEVDLRNPYPFTVGIQRDADIYGSGYDFYRNDPGQCFSGEINPSLIALRQLRYLDLSANCFDGLTIPNFLGSLKKLRYLNLSIAGFSGLVPSELGNLSALHTLDLSAKVLDSLSYGQLYVDSLHWLTHLASLQYLNLAHVDLGVVSHWVQALNALPSLRELHLHESNLIEIPHSLRVDLNFTSLTVLDISSNFFYSTLPAWLFNLSKLEVLDVHDSGFQGRVPVVLGDVFPFLQVLDLSYNDYLRLGKILKTLGNLCQLRTLSLSYFKIGKELAELQGMFSSCMADNLETLNLRNAHLTGFIPESILYLKKLKNLSLSGNKLVGPLPVTHGRLSSLQKLDLSYNKLNGTIFTSTWQFPELEYLDLSYNSLEGIFSEKSFSTFAKLKHMQLSKNSFVMEVNGDWVPPFRLESFSMSSCKLGTHFPAWLQTQVNLSSLDMSYASISDIIPLWFWNLTSQFYFLDISFNNIKGQLPPTLIFPIVRSSIETEVSMNSNLFHGPVPIQIISGGDIYLDLSNNSLSGPLPLMIHELWQNLNMLFLSMNKINGSIPSGFCKMKQLNVLDLSGNLLSGNVPDCWSTISVVAIINLGSNNLTSGVPKSLCSLSKLEILNLGANSLTGELPSCLKRCSNIIFLDVGRNKLSGMIPGWIGDSLSQSRTKISFFGKISTPPKTDIFEDIFEEISIPSFFGEKWRKKLLNNGIFF